MSRKVEEIENEVAQLSPGQLKEFRAWYEQFDSDCWDKQIEDDIKIGKLNALAEAAIADHKAESANDDLVWFWIGSHADYDKLIKP